MKNVSPERSELLGELSERIFDVVRHLRSQVTVPHEGLVHLVRSEADVMRVITSIPGATVSDIARGSGLHKSNASTSIAALVEKGLVEKRTADGDAREVRVYPTPAAVANIAGYRTIWADQLVPTTGATEAELRAAIDLLSEIAKNLGPLRGPNQY